MLVFGKSIQAGVNGTNVNLSNLSDDNQLQGMQFDYRQVFTTLLQDWLGANDEVLATTLFDSFAKIPLVDAAMVVNPDCYIGSTVQVWEGHASRMALRLSPNPASIRVEVAFESSSAFSAVLTLHSLGGSELQRLQVEIQPGINRYFLDVRALPPANYFVRLQNKKTGAADVAKLIKP